MIDLIIHTIVTRPYVIAFLITYLVLGAMYMGPLRTAIWLIVGYTIAWASEYASITTGFPYGWYHYIYDNLQGEWLVKGVPIWDSASYPFMIFASYTLARWAIGPFSLSAPLSSCKKWITFPLAGALLTTLLDVVTDPLAHQGEKWFLGKIYYYPTPGWYFDVPMANFAGWFSIAFTVIVVTTAIFSLFPPPRTPSKERYPIVYPLFYFAIALFNIIITYWIGDYPLAACSTIVMGAVLGWALKKHRSAMA